MFNFNDYLKLRKIDSNIGTLSNLLAEMQGVPLEQAKQQIMQILTSIPMDTAENATAKLTFLDQLMKQGVQALPELANLYKQEYPKLQQLQQTPQAPQQQPQQQTPQQAPQQQPPVKQS